MNTHELEQAVVNMLQTTHKRKAVIIPNAYWGVGIYHECDLLCIVPGKKNKDETSVIEIELKVSKADLLKDLKKEHGHRSDNIKYIYYAVPEDLVPIVQEKFPEHCGIITAKKNRNGYVSADYVRRPKANPNFTENKHPLYYYNLARLLSLRLFTVKAKLYSKTGIQLKIKF